MTERSTSRRNCFFLTEGFGGFSSWPLGPVVLGQQSREAGVGITVKIRVFHVTVARRHRTKVVGLGPNSLFMGKCPVTSLSSICPLSHKDFTKSYRAAGYDQTFPCPIELQAMTKHFSHDFWGTAQLQTITLCIPPSLGCVEFL